MYILWNIRYKTNDYILNILNINQNKIFYTWLNVLLISIRNTKHKLCTIISFKSDISEKKRKYTAKLKM